MAASTPARRENDLVSRDQSAAVASPVSAAHRGPGLDHILPGTRHRIDRAGLRGWLVIGLCDDVCGFRFFPPPGFRALLKGDK